MTVGNKNNYNSDKDKKQDKGINASYNTIANTYADNVVFNASQGHGYAAEKANHLVDSFLGKDAKIIGGDNKLNGADRLVDGKYIQTKYCQTAKDSINACFDKNGYKYMQDNAPMQVEVPRDQYKDALVEMQKRIERGEVPGVSDPQEAKNLVRKGHIDYIQSEKIAKFGTIEGITYDVLSGVKITGISMGLSAAITYATCMWHDGDHQEALKNSSKMAIKTMGNTLASYVIVQQIGRTGINSALRPYTNKLAKQLGSKACSTISKLASGKNLTGAAAKNHVSKLLRGNLVTGTVTTVIFSLNDIGNFFSSKISGKQLIKNVVVTGATTAGGIGGGMTGGAVGAKAGAMVGSFVAPGVGTAIGGFVGSGIGFVGGLVGGMIGGGAAGKATKGVLDWIVEDDAVKLMAIFDENLKKVAYEYMLNEFELEDLCKIIFKSDINGILKAMYASSDQNAFSYNYIEKSVQQIISKRNKIVLPSDEEIVEEICRLIECGDQEEESHNKVGNLFRNILSGGQIAATEKFVYFAHPSQKMCLCRKNRETDELTRLSDDIPKYMNIIGNSLYYLNQKDDTFYMCNLTGENKQKVFKLSEAKGKINHFERLLGIFVVKQTIYILCTAKKDYSSKQYVYEVTETGIKCIIESAEVYGIDEEYIYYVDNYRGFFKYRMSNGMSIEYARTVKESCSGPVIMVDQKLYYACYKYERFMFQDMFFYFNEMNDLENGEKKRVYEGGYNKDCKYTVTAQHKDTLFYHHGSYVYAYKPWEEDRRDIYHEHDGDTTIEALYIVDDRLYMMCREGYNANGITACFSIPI